MLVPAKSLSAVEVSAMLESLGLVANNEGILGYLSEVYCLLTCGKLEWGDGGGSLHLGLGGEPSGTDHGAAT